MNVEQWDWIDCKINYHWPECKLTWFYNGIQPSNVSIIIIQVRKFVNMFMLCAFRCNKTITTSTINASVRHQVGV